MKISSMARNLDLEYYWSASQVMDHGPRRSVHMTISICRELSIDDNQVKQDYQHQYNATQLLGSDCMVGVGPSVDSVSNLDCKIIGNGCAMRLAINTRNKTGFIDGTCLKETYTSSAVYSSQWDRCNSIVLSWLLNSVSDDLYLGQIFSENASEVWSELKETYDKLDGSVTLNLLNKIHNFKQGELTRRWSSILLEENIMRLRMPLLNSRENLHEAFPLPLQMNSSNDVPYGSKTLGNIQANLAASLRWIIDSGTNQHMTISTINMFGIVDVSDLSLTVGHPNSTLAKFTLDLWGPYKVVSKDGFRYFLTIVDDYTRGVWIYLLKTKDEVFDLFTSFINHIQNQFKVQADERSREEYLKDLKLEFHKRAFLANSKCFIKRTNNFSFQKANEDTECYKCGKKVFLQEIAFLKRLNLLINLRCQTHLKGQKVINPSLSWLNPDAVAKFLMLSLDRPDAVPRNCDAVAAFVWLFFFNFGVKFFSTTLNKTTEPTTYDEAIRNPKWIESMNNEIEALLRNNTWTVCDLPKGRKPVGSKWLWKIKFKSTGEIERYKSRVVAKGYSQREGFDYSETFSPVVKMSTVRCMLNVAICNGWDLFQLDVNNAFLYGDLTEEAPRQWNAKLTMTLVENGFVQSKYDYSLFTKTSGDMVLMLLVYVDDIVITGNDNSEIGKFKEMLKSKFQIKDLGNLKYFLGIEVIDNDDGVCLSQRKYCLEVLHEYGLLAGRPVETPLAENTTLNHVESEDDKLLSDIGNYQKLVGKLIYLTNTRPDISYAVHCLSQFMHAPLSSHLEAAFRVLRYLKNSPGSGIQINKVGNLKLRAYADSDWARCPATRKSVSGYCVFLGSSLITWKSKKQSTLSRSSAEAEYRSMASATCEVIWLSNLLGDMGVKNLLPVVLYCDNSSALQIAANPVFHEKSKHFEIDVHLVREKVASGVIVTEKIHTSQQIADVLTKALGSKQHDELCTKIGILDMFKVPQVDKT
ncbi:putative RNA-directed DNA polymerase [Tanacetum coccineum]